MRDEGKTADSIVVTERAKCRTPDRLHIDSPPEQVSRDNAETDLNQYRKSKADRSGKILNPIPEAERYALHNRAASVLNKVSLQAG